MGDASKKESHNHVIMGHKAKLNIHGGKQVYHANYFKTYAPVVTWFGIQFMMVLAIILVWAM
jgi:hypothetical protein